MKFHRKAIRLLLSPLIITTIFISCGFSVTLPRTEYTLTVIAGEEKFVFAYPETDYGENGLYLKGADAIAERIYYSTLVPPRDAAVSFRPSAHEKFTVTRERYGRAIDVEKLLKNIDSAVKNGVFEIEAEFVELKPQTRRSDLENCFYTRAFFSTAYGNSSAERKHNVAVAADAINGVCVEDGEVFSFNGVVGERTEERGYKNAKIIFEGKFTDGTGGGVCQVSSTLYNCALLAGVTVTERRAHSLAVSYVEPSFDAMVSYGGSDLKFLNDTGGPIFIEARADGETLSVTIYGRKKNYSIGRVSEIISETEVGYDYIDGEETDCGGEEKIIVPQKNAIKSCGYLVFYHNGKQFKKVRLGADGYAGQKGVIARGKISEEDDKTP
ncbi:MAG: VanW family protein [Clostridia bacterium]|nr:VanW family protein [Clostridia bacterium]